MNHFLGDSVVGGAAASPAPRPARHRLLPRPALSPCIRRRDLRLPRRALGVSSSMSARSDLPFSDRLLSERVENLGDVWMTDDVIHDRKYAANAKTVMITTTVVARTCFRLGHVTRRISSFRSSIVRSLYCAAATALTRFDQSFIHDLLLGCFFSWAFKIGRGGGIRTPTRGFGDRWSAVKPTPLLSSRQRSRSATLITHST